MELIFTFLFSFSMLFFLRKVAQHERVMLVDKPNARKLHEGSVPLVGGVSICLSILYFLYSNPALIAYSQLYSISIIILVGIGVLDDKFDISVRLRIFVQAGLALLMINIAGIKLIGVGDLLGFGYIGLPIFIDQFITILAVIGAINAFNMVDGIDGLLGGLASVTFAAIGILFVCHGSYSLAYLCAVFIVAIFPYILFNLGVFGRTRRVFMGDAGSMLIGFTVIWLLISISQDGDKTLRPVTALWLIALPLFDMAAIMIRRFRRGDSPFRPDREHLHHICQRIGLNSRQTLFAICSLSIVFAAIGIAGEVWLLPEYIMFYSFIVCFVLYTVLLSFIWKLVAKIRMMRNKLVPI